MISVVLCTLTTRSLVASPSVGVQGLTFLVTRQKMSTTSIVMIPSLFITLNSSPYPVRRLQDNKSRRSKA